MNRTITFLTLILLTLRSVSQPLVYFDFVTHNEETGQWNGANYYSQNRARLVTLSNYFQNNGISWNMQSDWVYLTNVLSQDSAYIATTNNKNILRWMFEDKGVEMDPHGHESQYIYPDLVKLMDSIGLPESKLMGGTLWNQSNGINVWMNLINGQYGLIFPNFFWQPDYMMGGGTPNHVNDLKYYGFWNPMDTVNYLTHDTTNHLRHIGVGCEIKIKDTTTVADVMSEIHDVVNNIQSGIYPANGFYLQTIFFEQGDLNNMMFYNKVIQVADSVNAIVATGVAQWKTLKEAYTIWESVFGAEIFQWECGQVSTDIQNIETQSNSFVYPNPFHTFAIVEINGKEEIYKLQVMDITGRNLKEYQSVNSRIEISGGDLREGIYFYQIRGNNQIISSGKFMRY